jgi:predicted anti-sigma-YlaC factor YlaD
MNNLNPLPPCAEFEFEIVELGEGSLAPEKARTVRAHLESCARCRNWRSSFAEVDARLAAALPRPALSADFASRLHARLGAESRRMPRNELRTAADQEYLRTLDALRRSARRNVVLAGLAVGVVAIGGLVLAPSLLPDAGSLLASFTAQQRLIGCGALGGVIALAGLAWSTMLGQLPTLRSFG